MVPLPAGGQGLSTRLEKEDVSPMHIFLFKSLQSSRLLHPGGDLACQDCLPDALLLEELPPLAASDMGRRNEAVEHPVRAARPFPYGLDPDMMDEGLDAGFAGRAADHGMMTVSGIGGPNMTPQRIGRDKWGMATEGASVAHMSRYSFWST